jgi:hypothetical protein
MMMKTRVIVWMVVLLGAAMLACNASQLIPQRQAAATVAATRTLKPTFTATATATNTAVPSATPPPTLTPTNTPIPSDTPVPTETPLPTLTPTVTDTPPPSPTPTNTTRPTPRPTRQPTNTPRPRPTNTPPPPFSGTIVRGYPHCGGYSGVTGQVKHANGSPYPGVAVGVWSPTWVGSVGISQADGKFDVPLTNVPPGEYTVAVVRFETCAQQDGQTTAIDCQRLSKEIKVTKTADCNVNQVTEIEFRGP